MTIWIEFPPAKDATARTAYIAKRVARGEIMQASPMVDATGTRHMVGSSRITRAQADEIAAAVPGLVVHTEFPSDWQFPDPPARQPSRE